MAMLIGFLVGLITFFAFNTKFQTAINLSDSVVFFILLPPMLFSDGFNLPKRRFFQNIFYINIYGVIGTIFNFLTIFGFMYAVNHYNLIRDFSNINIVRALYTPEILLFAAAMCSMDDVAATSSIKPADHPKLFSIIFGESLLKDVVTIVLFKSISNLIASDPNAETYDWDFEWFYPFRILGDFLLTIVVSVLIGIAYSIFLTFLFKACRFIVHTRGITELGLTFLVGYIAYLTSEIIGYSGIISMMVVGIMLSHFNIYNMSKSGVETSKLTFKTISIIAEGLLFLLLGLASWQFQNDEIEATVSWTFILFGFVALFLGRTVNIVVTTLLFYFCVGKDKWRLNVYEMEIISIAGLVKGAVPFALISTISYTDSTNKVNTMMLKSTIICIVFITSLFFNGLIPMFIKYNTKVMKEKIKEDHQSNVDTLKEQEMRNYESDLKGEGEHERKYRSKTQKYWKRLEEGFIKPFLIFNYRGRREEIREAKQKQRNEEFGIPLITYKDEGRAMIKSPLLGNDGESPPNEVHGEEEVGVGVEVEQSVNDTVFHSVRGPGIRESAGERKQSGEKNEEPMNKS